MSIEVNTQSFDNEEPERKTQAAAARLLPRAASRTLDPQQQVIARALGKVPSGVFIVTSQHDGRRAVMLASWVQQASFQPPAVSLAAARVRPIVEIIRGSRQFTLSIVAREDTALMKQFARPTAPEVDPLEGAAIEPVEAGAPALAGALAWLDCRLADICDFGGDHLILLAHVRAGAVLREGASFTHLRKSGNHY